MPRPKLLELLRPGFSAQIAVGGGTVAPEPPLRTPRLSPLLSAGCQAGLLSRAGRARSPGSAAGYWVVQGFGSAGGTRMLNLRWDGKRHLPDTKTNPLPNFTFPLQHLGDTSGAAGHGRGERGDTPQLLVGTPSPELGCSSTKWPGTAFLQ